MNGEIKRRTEVVGIFLNDDATIGRVGSGAAGLLVRRMRQLPLQRRL